MIKFLENRDHRIIYIFNIVTKINLKKNNMDIYLYNEVISLYIIF